MSLVNYSNSSSSESDSEEAIHTLPAQASIHDEPQRKLAKLCVGAESRYKLPKAIELLGVSKAPVDIEETTIDDPAKHNGRKRSFKHERGNWATYIFIPVKPSILDDIQEMCQNAVAGVVDLRLATDLHISLSRTVVLQYHLIDSFVKSLEEALVSCTRFSACLNSLKIYTNEEKTRTFIAFKVDDLYFEKVHKLMSRIDGVMHDYKLPEFYEDPSFHISFLWCLDDKVDILSAHLGQLTALVKTLNERETFRIDINEIRCKTGNKDFTFVLK